MENKSAFFIFSAVLAILIIASSVLCTSTDETIINIKQNIAYVASEKVRLDIDKFESKSGEAVNLNISSIDKITSICFEFPENLDLISIDEIKVKRFLIDNNILSKETRKGKMICFEGLDLSTDEISYRLSYAGHGTLKYNVIAGDVILDPYIIGGLAEDPRLILWLPFDGNLKSKYSSREMALNASATRQVATASEFAYSGDCVNPTNFDDNNVATYAGLTYNCGDYSLSFTCQLQASFAKIATDTGMVAEITDSSGTTNTTVTSDCFSYYANKVVFMTQIYRHTASCGFACCYYDTTETDSYCWDGNTWQLLKASSGSLTANEISTFNTNQSGFSAYYQANLDTMLYNTNITSGWLFDNYTQGMNLWNSPNATAYGNVTFNKSGAGFNGSQFLNLTVNATFMSNNFTIIARIKPYCSGTQHIISNRQYSDTVGLFDFALSGCQLVLYGINGTSTIASTAMLTSGAYNTVAVVKNNSNTTLYVNGVRDTSLYGVLNVTNNTQQVLIGQVQNVQFFNGTIKWLQIYNRSLNSQSIYDISNQGNYTNNTINGINASLSLPGDEAILISNNSLSTYGNYSICFWVRPKNIANSPALFDLSAFVYGRFTETYYYFNTYNVGSTMLFPMDVWTHVCNTYDGLTAKSYQNGILNTSFNGSDFLLNPTGKKTIATSNFNGSIDDFMLYNYVLSPTQAYTLANGYSAVTNLLPTTCSGTDEYLVRFKIFDEQNITSTNASSTTIQIYLNITPTAYPTLSFNYSTTAYGNDIGVCVLNGVYNETNFTIGGQVIYSATDYMPEFGYIVNATATQANPQVIQYYDLVMSQSTTYLVTYQDESYLYVPDVRIDLLRKYVNQNNQFVVVEQAKTDAGGQTRLHLESENVIYKFNVYNGTTLLYSSPEYIALCQTAPCQINLRFETNATDEISNYGNIIYTLTNDTGFSATNNIKFDFSTTDGGSAQINMTLYDSNIYSNHSICNSSLTAISGQVNCSVNLTYQNMTYTAVVYKDGKLIGYKTYTQERHGSEYLGKDTSIFLTVIVYLSLSFMAISSPIISILVGMVGLIAMIVIQIFNSGSLFGIGSAMIWLFIAVVIIVWKFNQRRIS